MIITMLLGPMVVEMMLILRILILVCADDVFHFFIFYL